MTTTDNPTPKNAGATLLTRLQTLRRMRAQRGATLHELELLNELEDAVAERDAALELGEAVSAWTAAHDAYAAAEVGSFVECEARDRFAEAEERLYALASAEGEGE